MDLERHDFQLDELVERIREGDHKLVALQLPEGLKIQALEMIDELESKTDAKLILAADPCYGACDLVHNKMQMMLKDYGASTVLLESRLLVQYLAG